MPIFFQQEIDCDTRLAVWKIEEEEAFFAVPLQREITHPQKRLQHLAGRYLLRYLFPDFPLDLIKVAGTRKPYLDGDAFHFSISHCGSYAAAIVSRTKRVGVDVEVPTPKVDKIKHKFLHNDELERLNGACGLNAGGNGESKSDLPLLTSLTLLWSAKEAVFKWWSYGSVDFSEMIRIDDFLPKSTGEISSRFLTAGESYTLRLHYTVFDNLCLAWLKD